MDRLALPIPTPADARTRRAMLQLFFEQSRTSLVAAVLLMGLQTAYIGNRVPLWMMAAWIAGGSLLLVARWRWRRRYLALDDSTATAQATLWQRRVLVGSALTGVLWGSAVLMDFNPADPASQMFCAMLICVTCVASVNVMAPVPQAYWALQFPAVAALALSLALLGSWTGIYFAALVLVGAAMAIGLAHRHARLLFESHELRYEREGLLAQVQEASVAKSRFLASASHDMRQPLHALGLLGARLNDQLAGRQAAATGLQMQSMVQTLDTLVEALMDLSRLDAAAVTLTRRPFPLSDVFDHLATEFAVVAQARDLQWRIRPTDAWIESDPVQLERVLRNLLSNALRYTANGGVLMAAQRRGVNLRIGIWDTGPGIAPSDQERVFDEFVQLNNPGRDRGQGLGLGLAIVRRLARLLDHPLALRSRPGRGALFSILVPQAPAGTDGALPDSLLASANPDCMARVALIEDDQAVRDATSALLQHWGIEVWADAAVAPLLVRLQETNVMPTLIISDWRLTEGDGLLAIAAIRDRAGAMLPALLISGEALPASLRDLGSRNITAARKPLAPASLRAWLSSPAAGLSATPIRP